MTGPTDPALRARLLDLQDWLMHPDRAYSPHEIATYAHDEIAAALAAAEAAPLDVERVRTALHAAHRPYGPGTCGLSAGDFIREYAALRSPDTETAE